MFQLILDKTQKRKGRKWRERSRGSGERSRGSGEENIEHRRGRNIHGGVEKNIAMLLWGFLKSGKSFYPFFKLCWLRSRSVG